MGKLFDVYTRSYCLDSTDSAEFFDCINDLYNSEQVQGLQKYVQHSTINRLDHIRSVTYVTFVYCKRFSLDFRTAARAAILHDLFYYDWHENDWSHRPHGYRHPGFALKNARELNPSISRKEENIILRHMWPLTVIPPASREGFIVTLADKYCAVRELLIADRKYFRDKFEKNRQRLIKHGELKKDV